MTVRVPRWRLLTFLLLLTALIAALQEREERTPPAGAGPARFNQR